MPWQVFHKRRPSNCLPAVRLHAGHPPLTSLCSFAPPYAPRRGRTNTSALNHIRRQGTPPLTSLRNLISFWTIW